MPQIKILEDNLTRGTASVNTDIPLIPGFGTYNYAAVPFSKVTGTTIGNYYIETDTGYTTATGTPNSSTTYYMRTNPNFSSSSPTIKLCSTVAEFEKEFGSSAPSIDSSIDKSYIVAKELLALGMPVYYFALRAEDDSTYESLTTEYEDFLEDDFADKDAYNVKYITSGGMANFTSGADTELWTKMLTAASTRGDCIALVEGPYDTTNTTTNHDTFYTNINTALANKEGSYAAAFTPWANYTLQKKYGDTRSAVLPGYFAYLATLAKNIHTSPNWLAMAGVARGLVPNITSLATNASHRLSNPIADSYQPTVGTSSKYYAINPITLIQPYGLAIWGNRTLHKVSEEGLDALNFLNTRNMISDIKKVVYRAAKAQLFEQNSEVLWLNFKADVSPLLEQLKAGNGISDYKFIKLDTHYNGNSLGKEEFACAIKIYPMYAVESFEITVAISDTDVAVG